MKNFVNFSTAEAFVHVDVDLQVQDVYDYCLVLRVLYVTIFTGTYEYCASHCKDVLLMYVGVRRTVYTCTIVV